MRTFITEKHKEECIESIKRLVRIPSVLNEGEGDTPFGKDIQFALEDALALCRELGFSTYILKDIMVMLKWEVEKSH